MPHLPVDRRLEDRANHRRWVLTAFGLYCIALIAIAAISFATRSAADVNVASGTRIDGPTQKLRPLSHSSSVTLSSAKR